MNNRATKVVGPSFARDCRNAIETVGVCEKMNLTKNKKNFKNQNLKQHAM